MILRILIAAACYYISDAVYLQYSHIIVPFIGGFLAYMFMDVFFENTRKSD
jgi:hypothetical protein